MLHAKLLQFCPTLFDSVDCSQPSSSVQESCPKPSRPCLFCSPGSMLAASPGLYGWRHQARLPWPIPITRMAWGQDSAWAPVFWWCTPTPRQHCRLCTCMPWSKTLRPQKYTWTVKGPTGALRDNSQCVHSSPQPLGLTACLGLYHYTRVCNLCLLHRHLQLAPCSLVYAHSFLGPRLPAP